MHLGDDRGRTLRIGRVEDDDEVVGAEAADQVLGRQRTQRLQTMRDFEQAVALLVSELSLTRLKPSEVDEQ